MMRRRRRRFLATAPVTAVAAVPLFASPASAATRTHWQMDEPPGTGVMHDDTGTINGPPMALGEHRRRRQLLGYIGDAAVEIR
jgi:hypothetical protein